MLEVIKKYRIRVRVVKCDSFCFLFYSLSAMSAINSGIASIEPPDANPDIHLANNIAVT